MVNMPHCRFENTYETLKEAYEHMQVVDFDDLSESEKIASYMLVDLCEKIAKEFEEIK